MPLKTVCIFCGSQLGQRRAFEQAARRVGQLMVARRMTLVYGGGRVGLMGVIADTVMQAGGSAIGVIPESLAEQEVAHEGLTELHVVHSMHARKAMMAELSDAFVALPGGYGTLEELCEIVTWSQLGFHNKPCGILNVDGYYDALLRQFELGVDEGFISERHRKLIWSCNAPDELFDRLHDSWE